MEQEVRQRKKVGRNQKASHTPEGGNEEGGRVQARQRDYAAKSQGQRSRVDAYHNTISP